MHLYLDAALQPFFPQMKACARFDAIMQLSGEKFRQQKNRITERITLGDRTYFIKKHYGIGLKEMLKNLITGRLPVMGARNEWRALEKLAALAVHVPRVVAFGERGRLPLTRQSFIIMEEIKHNHSLETLSLAWQTQAPSFALKQKLLAHVAHITRTLHQHEMDHRDLYICHFLLDTNASLPLKLFLIDLHRAHIHTKLPARWRIKDLASLYFSSKNVRLTSRDYLRFMALYRGVPWTQLIDDETKFWQKVKLRGEKLYQKHAALFQSKHE